VLAVWQYTPNKSLSTPKGLFRRTYDQLVHTPRLNTLPPTQVGVEYTALQGTLERILYQYSSLTFAGTTVTFFFFVSE
jgi:hypothetical protein